MAARGRAVPSRLGWALLALSLARPSCLAASAAHPAAGEAGVAEGRSLLVKGCTGNLAFAGIGSGKVALISAAEGTPGSPAAPADVVGEQFLLPRLSSRTYFGTSCAAGPFQREEYAAIDFLGKTLRYTVDLAGAGCGCAASVFLTLMRYNQQPGECAEDHFCDASSLCGVACTQVDLQMANQHAFLTALHAYHYHWGADEGGTRRGFGGAGRDGSRDFGAKEYGPGAKCVDTNKPYRVGISFHKNAKGGLDSVETVLSQPGRPCNVTTRVSRYAVEWAGLTAPADGLDALGQALRAGMTPVVSYWQAARRDLVWLSGTEDSHDGPCPGKREAAPCPETIKFYDFSIADVGAPVPDVSSADWPSTTLTATNTHSRTSTSSARSTSTGNSTTTTTTDPAGAASVAGDAAPGNRGGVSAAGAGESPRSTSHAVAGGPTAVDAAKLPAANGVGEHKGSSTRRPGSLQGLRGEAIALAGGLDKAARSLPEDQAAVSALSGLSGGQSAQRQGNGTNWVVRKLCPLPEPVPSRFTVEHRGLSLGDSFFAMVDGVELGRTHRRWDFAWNEMRLFTPWGDTWGTAKKRFFSRVLLFLDCTGQPIATFEANWSWTGRPVAGVLRGVDGKAIGRVSVDAADNSAEAVVTLWCSGDQLIARLHEGRSFLASSTNVTVLDIKRRRLVAARPSSILAAVEPPGPEVCADPLVLTLFVGMRYGANLPPWEVSLAALGAFLVLLCVLLLCCRALCVASRRQPEGGLGSAINTAGSPQGKLPPGVILVRQGTDPRIFSREGGSARDVDYERLMGKKSSNCLNNCMTFNQHAMCVPRQAAERPHRFEQDKQSPRALE